MIYLVWIYDTRLVYVTCVEFTFFCALASFSLPAAGLLLRSRLRGTPGACVYTDCGASSSPVRAPWLVLWAFKIARAGSFSRDFAFRDAEPRRTMETPQFQRFALLLLPHRPMFQALYFVAATVQQQSHHQALPFVTPADGCFCVCACVRVCHVSCRPINRKYHRDEMNTSYKGAGQLIGCCAWGQGTIPGTAVYISYVYMIPHLPRNFESNQPRSHGTYTLQRQQQRHNSARAWSSGLCDNHGAIVCGLCAVCSVYVFTRRKCERGHSFTFSRPILKINFKINHTLSDLILYVHTAAAAAVIM